MIADAQFNPDEFVDLPSSESLSANEANTITSSSITRVILPVGLIGVGKTTLITALYECFLRGPFASYRFAWSRTLHGLERRSRLARIASQRNLATTPRTTLAESDSYLHLRLSAERSGASIPDLLVADVSGEIFEAVHDDVEFASSLRFLDRVDHISFLVDAQKLSDLTSRHNAAHETDMLIRSFLDAGVVHAAKSVIYTKWDAIAGGDGIDELEDFISQFEHRLRRKYDRRSGGLEFIRTASRPIDGTERKLEMNLDQVLQLWLNSSRCPIRAPSAPVAPTSREFDRFRALALTQI